MQMFPHDPSIPTRGLALLAALALTPLASAQVSSGGHPRSFEHALPTPPPVVVVAAPDVAALRAEDIARGHKPLRYGSLLDLRLSLDDGTWTTLPDGSRVWQVRITSPGAKSLAVEFELFGLSSGSRMFVFDHEVETILGAYTQQNEHEDGGFVFEPFPGETLTLEIDVPRGEDEPLLYTRTLIYDYRDIFGLMEGRVTISEDDGDSNLLGACLIDVNCPQGDSWNLQKRATVRTLSGGSLCSAALINNTANDGTRYVLSADHCGQGGGTVFTFKYQRTGCGSGGASESMTVSGSTLLATNAQMDCRLMRINSAIPDTYEPYFAGWSRSTSNSNFAFALGHPSGGPKKISIDGNGSASETWFWRFTWSEGTLEGGSSGGPVFDQNGRVRGPACCVNNFTCSQTAWFGRFDRFWTANNLAQWLDPLGTNPTNLDGFDPIVPPCTPDVQSYCTTSPNSIGTGALMGYSGSLSLADNNFFLEAYGVAPGQFGIFYYGPNQASIAFGNGIRCVGGGTTGTFRLPPRQADTFGDLQYQLRFDQPPANSGAGQIMPNSTWRFQAWYRDPAGGGAGFNLSDGLRITFCP